MQQNKDKLLILDLDETLLHATARLLARPVDFQVGEYYVYKRPNVDGFLAWCCERFDVAVWTSASPDYAAGIVASLFPQPPVFTWAGDRCTLSRDWETGEQCWAKNLKKVRQLGYTLDNVIVIDDSPEKHRKNYGNLVRVTPYTGAETDAELSLLIPYLDKLRVAENIRVVEKRRWRSEVGMLENKDYPTDGTG